MESHLESRLDTVIDKLEVLAKRHQHLIALYEHSESDVRENVQQPKSRFIAPNNKGQGQQEAVTQFLRKWRSEGEQIPSSVKRILNPYQLEAGDLILVRPKKPDDLGVFGRIKWSQTIDTQRKLIRDEEHASYTHAAISRNYHQIYESIPENGIFRTEYWRYMTGKYDVKVRRLKGLDHRNRSQISHNVAELFGKSYGFIELATIKAMANEWPWLEKIAAYIGRDDTYICSALFAIACEKENIDLNLLPSDLNSKVVTPAHLSASDALEDVEVDWVNI